MQNFNFFPAGGPTDSWLSRRARERESGEEDWVRDKSKGGEKGWKEGKGQDREGKGRMEREVLPKTALVAKTDLLILGSIYSFVVVKIVSQTVVQFENCV